MKITTSGIDVAKSVFQVHGVHASGEVVLRRQIRRSRVLRGLLAEHGLVLAQGANQVRSKLPALLEDGSESLPPLAVELFRDLYQELVQLEERIAACDRRAS